MRSAIITFVGVGCSCLIIASGLTGETLYSPVRRFRLGRGRAVVPSADMLLGFTPL